MHRRMPSGARPSRFPPGSRAMPPRTGFHPAPGGRQAGSGPAVRPRFPPPSTGVRPPPRSWPRSRRAARTCLRDSSCRHCPARRAWRPATGGMARRNENDRDHGVLGETGKPEAARPPLYSVLLLNDDYPPMDFVVEVLVRFFAMNLEKATQVMLHVHTRGRGVCGVYTREVAESKVAQVNEFRSEEHTSELQSRENLVCRLLLEK